MQVFGALPTSSDICDFCDQALSQGGVVYTLSYQYKHFCFWALSFGGKTDEFALKMYQIWQMRFCKKILTQYFFVKIFIQKHTCQTKSMHF